jgi:predicted metal-binding membrane protein
MIADLRELARVRYPVLILSVLAWVPLLTGPGSGLIAHCPATADAPSRASVNMLLAMNPPLSFAGGWVLMLVAMMSPLLIHPVSHVRLSSFRHRRIYAMALFLAGYVSIWMVAGALLFVVAIVAGLYAAQSWTPVAMAFLVAAVWQASPAKQRCLNGCHSLRSLVAFGRAADLDALCFGLEHGSWCVGSCWALMLVPMLLVEGHTLVMGASAFLMFSERLEPPGQPAWRIRGLIAIRRIVVARFIVATRGRKVDCLARRDQTWCSISSILHRWAGR